MQKAKRWHTWKRLDAGERLVGAECCAEHDRARLERTSINIYIYVWDGEMAEDKKRTSDNRLQQ